MNAPMNTHEHAREAFALAMARVMGTWEHLSPETRAVLRTYVPDLAAALTAASVAVDHLEATEGPAPTPGATS